MADYIKPSELMEEVLEAGKTEACLSVHSLLIRGMLAGAFLGFATSLVLGVLAQGLRLCPLAKSQNLGFTGGVYETWQ